MKRFIAFSLFGLLLFCGRASAQHIDLSQISGGSSVTSNCYLQASTGSLATPCGLQLPFVTQSTSFTLGTGQATVQLTGSTLGQSVTIPHALPASGTAQRWVIENNSTQTWSEVCDSGNILSNGSSSTSVNLVANSWNDVSADGTNCWVLASGALVSGQTNNQIGYATGPTQIGGTIPCNVTGYIMAGINAAPPACNPTGAVGPQITTSPYTAQCDTTSNTVDRGTTLKFMSGSGTLVVPRPGDTGCPNFTFAVEVEISSLTVNREAGASYTFSIHDGRTTTTGATSFTLANGTWAFFKQDNYGCSPESTCIMDVDEVQLQNLGTPTTLILTNATGLPTAGLLNNAVPSAKMAVVNTRRTCDIAVGDTSASAITNAQLGPQKRICYIPAAATIVEMDVAADGGTPNVIVAVNHAGSDSNIVSGALATAASGGIACTNTGGTIGIDGATTCTNTLQNTSMAAGDYLELVSGTAGGTAKLMTIHVIYVVN